MNRAIIKGLKIRLRRIRLDEELVQRANRIADVWHFGTKPENRPALWHKIRDAALKELREVAKGKRL